MFIYYLETLYFISLNKNRSFLKLTHLQWKWLPVVGTVGVSAFEFFNNACFTGHVSGQSTNVGSDSSGSPLRNAISVI